MIASSFLCSGSGLFAMTTPSLREKCCPGVADEVGRFASVANELAYACVVPSEGRRDTGILFVHAAGGNRLGPHRMFVELARRFNALGYATLRFDLSGCGDSGGRSSEDDVASEIADVVAAVHFLRNKINIRNVVLLGISRGAFVCHQVMAQHALPLSGVVMLSPPVSGGKVAARSFAARAREYAVKLTDPAHVRKLLRGRADVRQIWRTLVAPLTPHRRYLAAQTGTIASKCPVLLIYAGRDSILHESKRYYGERCRESRLPYECHIIPGANHSFFHYRWTRQVSDYVSEWLGRIEQNGEQPHAESCR